MYDLSALTITSLESVLTVSSERGRLLEMQNRKSWGLSFCVQGKIIYSRNGKKFVSDRDHAILLPKGASYTLHGAESGSFPLINFQCAHGPEDFLEIPLHSPESYLRDFQRLKSAALFRHARPMAMGIFYDILYRLSGELTATNGVLLPAVRHLEQSFDDPGISNTVLAEMCGISEIYFRQLFKASFGVSPKQYILELRIGKAKALLSGSSESVARTAELCGFTNPYHFSRAFHQAVGMTPTQYRKTSRFPLL